MLRLSKLLFVIVKMSLGIVKIDVEIDKIIISKSFYRVRHKYLNGTLDGYGTETAKARSMKLFTAIYNGV